MSTNYVSSGDSPVVPFSDDQSDENVRDDELIVDDPQLALTNPVLHKERQEKRRSRAAERERERKEQAAELAALREQAAKSQRELAELRGFVSGNARRQAADSGKDPYEERLDAVYARQKDAYSAYKAELIAAGDKGLPAAREKHYEQVSREIESDKQTIHTERVMASREPVQQQQSARQQWVSKYPEVYNNPRAYQFAEATFRQKHAMMPEGSQVTNEMVEEAMQAARAQFKLGPKPAAASASERSRMSGIPSSGAGGGGGDASGGVQMTKDLRKMATALYSDLPEEEALKKWANGPGRELRKQKLL